MSITPEITPVVEYVSLPFEYSKERKKGIGLVVPYDFALDDECLRWLPANVPLYTARTLPLASDMTVSVEQAERVSDAEAVVPTVRSLLAASPTTIAYVCTSGSFVNGREGEAELRSVMTEAGAQHAVTTSGALLAALRDMGITKIAIATPYNEALTHLLADFLESAGVRVVKAGYLNSERDIMHIDYAAVRNMAQLVNHPEAEAIFFSCTNLRTFDVIAELEQSLRKPVLSANQVTMWAALQEAGLPIPPVKQRLFTR